MCNIHHLAGSACIQITVQESLVLLNKTRPTLNEKHMHQETVGISNDLAIKVLSWTPPPLLVIQEPKKYNFFTIKCNEIKLQ